MSSTSQTYSQDNRHVFNLEIMTRAFTAFKHICSGVSWWQEVKDIFSLPDFYKPINLTFFLLKSIGTICDDLIKQQIPPIHLASKQHTYVKGLNLSKKINLNTLRQKKIQPSGLN